MDDNGTFIPLRQASHHLGVPLAWLRSQAETGQIPAIKTGARWHVELKVVEEQLRRRAEVGAETDG